MRNFQDFMKMIDPPAIERLEIDLDYWQLTNENNWATLSFDNIVYNGSVSILTIKEIATTVFDVRIENYEGSTLAHLPNVPATELFETLERI